MVIIVAEVSVRALGTMYVKGIEQARLLVKTLLAIVTISHSFQMLKIPNSLVVPPPLWCTFTLSTFPNINNVAGNFLVH